MKLKVTKKEILNSGNKIICINYCKAQNLLIHTEPFAYSCGVYGWACDYYDIGGVIISTGYNPIGEYADRNILDKYEEKAEKINCNYNLSYEEQKKQTAELLSEFIKEVI